MRGAGRRGAVRAFGKNASLVDVEGGHKEAAAATAAPVKLSRW